ncbi:hypothetical protein CFB45_07040 [Burkholderia sp. HI2500]|nr:hypothetical protein CFB45_07040 [Burkholderia sp. HI2500]
MEQEHHQDDGNVELVIEHRPSIQVFRNRAGSVTVSVTSISESLEHVTSDSVAIPLECCEEVGNALIALANKR